MDDSPLGALSPEIRNRVYEFALYERRPVSISKNFPPDAPLLRTCKQVRGEAHLLYYTINRFSCTVSGREDLNIECLRRWLSTGPSQKFALIQSLTIRVEFLWSQINGPEVHEDEEGIYACFEKLEVSRMLNEMSFGDRPLQCVVNFNVHGRDDDELWNEVFGMEPGDSQLCQMASFWMQRAVYGQEAVFPSHPDAMIRFAELQDKLRASRGKMTVEETAKAKGKLNTERETDEEAGEAADQDSDGDSEEDADVDEQMSSSAMEDSEVEA